MGKRIRDYVKYTFSELENYAKSPQSCVNKINTKLHMNFPPYGLSNFRETLREIIAQKKIGFYDAQMKGIILDIRNIKVLSDLGVLRFDDPAIHLDIQSDCYVFQPEIGTIVRGVVKHISDRQIGVIIFRVFSVSIRLGGRVPQGVTFNSEIEFRIKQFNLENTMPFIEGQLVGNELDNDGEASTPTIEIATSRKRILFKEEPKENRSSGYESDGSHSKRITLKREQSTSSSDEDDSDRDSVIKVNTEPNRISAESPDIFAGASESGIIPEQQIKQEKFSQTPSKEVPLQIKQENLSQTPQKRANKKSSNSAEASTSKDSETDTVPPIKIEKLSQSSEKKTRRKVSESSENEMKPPLIETPEVDLIQSSSTKRKRKHVESADELSPVVVTKKRKKTALNTEVVLIDSDIEMTTTIPDKYKKKKKKSKDELNDSTEVLGMNETVDLIDASGKKRKSKNKDETVLHESLSQGSVRKKIKREKSM